MAQSEWSLDPGLEANSVALGDFALSRVILCPDANYPWLIVVPRRAGLVEIIDLDEAAQTTLMAEIARAARALKAVTCCDKLNIAALGNAVRQLHVHVIARFRGDAAGAGPVWGVVPARAYEPAARDALVASLRREMGLT